MKRYIKPSTRVVKIQIRHMIADSFKQFNDDVINPRAKGGFLFGEEDDTDPTIIPFTIWEE